MKNEEISILVMVLVLMVGVLRNAYLAQFERKTDYSNKNLIPWFYSENQGTWVSPKRILPQKKVFGNVYLGDKIFPTWDDFNKK